MGLAMAMAAVAAVLGSNEVVLVQVEQREVLARVSLPEEGAAIFAAPDGAAIVPLVQRDATAVVRADGRMRVEPGRVFPLFFDEFDRMFVVLPEQLVLLAYPQRVSLFEVPLPGIQAVRHAAVTSNGLAVALVSATPASPGVWVVTTSGDARLVPVPTPCAAQRVALAPNGEWLAVACADGRLVLAGIGGHGADAMTLGGEITAMVTDGNGGDLLLAVALPDGHGVLLRLRVRSGASPPARERVRTPLPRPPRALATSGASVLVLDDQTLTVWERGGRRLAGEIAVPDGTALALLREAAGVMPESWGEPGPR